MENDELKDVKDNLDLLMNMEILAGESDWQTVKNLNLIPPPPPASAPATKNDEGKDDDND